MIVSLVLRFVIVTLKSPFNFSELFTWNTPVTSLVPTVKLTKSILGSVLTIALPDPPPSLAVLSALSLLL